MSGTLLPIAAQGLATNPIPPCSPGLTLKLFRKMFPAFADSSVYIDEHVQPMIDIGNSVLPYCRWGQYYLRGVGLFVAHNLALDRMTQLQAQRGGAPGFGIGLVSSKSVNGVSVSYDTGVGSLTDGADLNLTIFGLQLLRLARMVGAGPIQVVGTDAANVSEADLLLGTGANPQFLGV